ncbi:metal-dependent phosphohydrolase [Candidatus Pacearchaeota archaeon]|nr:metal-dependent phosphohydrolase [Candidatus Pacearchaeota archaeon]
MEVKMKIVEEVRKFVEEECKKPTSNYGADSYEHMIYVYHNVKVLAERFDADLDLEVVKLAALLHDIGSIIVERKDHHITGAEIAEKKLRELNYPEEKIELVKKCILNHRGSVNNGRESAEEQILADADAMAAFDNIDGLFMAALVYEKRERVDARKSVLNKVINSYNKLSPEAREMAKPKYEAAMLLLDMKNAN